MPALRWREAGLAALVAALAVSCTLVRTEQPQLPPPEHPDTSEHRIVRGGHEAFHTYCASCHGTSGAGDGPLAAELRTPPADLTRIAARRGGTFPEHQIHEYIDGRRRIRGHGSRDMPVWGRRFEQSMAGGEQEEQTRGRLLEIVFSLKTIQVEDAP